MKTILLSMLLIGLGGCSQAFAQAEPTPLPTPSDIPVPPAQSAKPAATPAATCPMCGSADCAESSKPAADLKTTETDEAILTRLEQDWGDAIQRHDAEFLERTEADDYTYTGPDGVVSHKADEIAGAKAGFAKIESFKHRDIKVHVYGDTAVLTGATTLKGSAGDTDVGGDFRWTDVFVKRGGQWQVVASQATAISRSAQED